MHNKKSLLQRLLVIYITFFIVLAVSIAHSLLPNFTKGFDAGTALGRDIAESWTSGTPRSIYLLGDVILRDKTPFETDGLPSGDKLSVKATVKSLDLTVEQEAPGASALGLAFGSVGGSPWIYVLILLNSLFYAAIIVLMFIIIHSLRKSIRNERTLNKRNVWYLRAIGVLTILSELCRDVADWWMSSRAVEVLEGSGLAVNAVFTVSYSNIIMGILILFAAEVFAIGQNLSEEQKLTI